MWDIYKTSCTLTGGKKKKQGVCWRRRGDVNVLSGGAPVSQRMLGYLKAFMVISVGTFYKPPPQRDLSLFPAPPSLYTELCACGAFLWESGMCGWWRLDWPFSPRSAPSCVSDGKHPPTFPSLQGTLMWLHGDVSSLWPSPGLLLKMWSSRVPSTCSDPLRLIAAGGPLGSRQAVSGTLHDVHSRFQPSSVYVVQSHLLPPSTHTVFVCIIRQAHWPPPPPNTHTRSITTSAPLTIQSVHKTLTSRVIYPLLCCSFHSSRHVCFREVWVAVFFF